MAKRFGKISVVFVALITIALGVLSGCSKGSSVAIKEEKPVESTKPTFTNISPQDAKKRLDNEMGIILIDVRTMEEYETGHIKGSRLIPADTLEKEAETKLKDKEAVIFVYCRSGNRSVTAANILIKLGYKNVYNLGGIKDWPYEIEK